MCINAYSLVKESGLDMHHIFSQQEGTKLLAGVHLKLLAIIQGIRLARVLCNLKVLSS
jgi:hypothetical protein